MVKTLSIQPPNKHKEDQEPLGRAKRPCPQCLRACSNVLHISAEAGFGRLRRIVHLLVVGGGVAVILLVFGVLIIRWTLIITTNQQQ